RTSLTSTATKPTLRGWRTTPGSAAQPRPPGFVLGHRHRTRAGDTAAVVGGDPVVEERLDWPTQERLRHHLAVDDQAGKAVQHAMPGQGRAGRRGGPTGAARELGQ